MKKLIFLLPFLLIACKKDTTVISTTTNPDSVLVSNQKTSDEKINQDSLIANSPAVEKVLDEGVNRSTDKNEIIRTAVGSMLPFKIGDQFTEDNQKLILKIKNVSKPHLKISIETKNPMNIRVNQIKYPDGSFDGPFGQTLKLDTPQKGEYWIIIGKSLMADGNSKGHFSLEVE
ncbi:hypothetical protein [Halpernia sp.]|uniref:hypothetical protein n=1 Tax=Halpernia sp. TaxID=2782209 RepID=UPI003A94501C